MTTEILSLEDWHMRRVLKRYQTPQTSFVPVGSLDPIEDAILVFARTQREYPTVHERFPGFENISFEAFLQTQIQELTWERLNMPEHPQAGWSPYDQGDWVGTLWAIYFEWFRRKGVALSISERETYLLARVQAVSGRWEKEGGKSE